MAAIAAAVAGSVISGAMANKGAKQQAKATQDANEKQYEIDLQNLAYQRERDDADRALLKEQNSKAEARQNMLQQMMNEGYTDPTNGTTTKYVPGQGWVTTYNQQAGALVKGSQREQLLQIVRDAAQARSGRDANAARRTKEGANADATLAELNSGDPYNTDRIVADLTAARRRGVNEGFDNSTKQVLTSNTRTGTASDHFLLEAAKERAKALTDANAGAYSEGLGLSEDLRGARTSRLGNQYNTMATRASNVDNIAFQPTDLPGQGQNLAGKASPGAANQNMLNPTTGRPGATMNTSNIKPNLVGATSTYANGQSLDNLFKTISNSLGNSSSGRGPAPNGGTWVDESNGLPWLNNRTSGSSSY
jgi:hypothetical protein